MRSLAICLVVAFSVLITARLTPDLSKTPPMGFNSWNHFGLDINEEIIKEIADAFVRLGLDSVGYQYINIDDGWALKERDNAGHVVVDEKKFPNGIKHVADYAHSKGLKFGIYSDAGVYTCGGQAGSLGYEKIDAADYDEWGVDYLKYDNCFNQGITSVLRYSVMSEALRLTSRDIFYSLCNWGVDSVTDWGWLMLAGSWRISGDITDNWSMMVRNIQALLDETNSRHGPGVGWNDPDMLEVGNGGMSYDQYVTHFSIWCLMKSPLLIGNDVRKMTIEDDAYWILTNREAIAVNQDPLGVQGECVLYCGELSNLQIWTAPLTNNAYAVAIINFSDNDSALNEFKWTDLGLSHSTYHVRDLWTHRNEGIFANTYGGHGAHLKTHSTKLLRVTEANAGDCELHPDDPTPFESKPCPTISF